MSHPFAPLGLTPRQLAFIIADEAATPDQATEAARRMLQNLQFTSGQLRSPAAFYRGILRRVVAECPPPQKTAAASPPPADQAAARRILAELAARLAAQR